MKSSLFIKTCVKDYHWLEWCLKSIDKYGLFDEYIVAIGISDYHTIPAHLKREPFQWIKVEDDLDIGYLNQQLIKHHADLYCTGDYIMYMDSDCVFTSNVTIEDYLVDGKPILPYTPYSVLGNQVPWKPIVERCLGFEPENEFMRRHPLVFKPDTLKDMREWFEAQQGTTLAKYIKRQPNKEYSEFNVLGSWAYKYQFHDYEFMNTEEHDNIPCNVRQFWSWEAMSEADRNELKEICN